MSVNPEWDRKETEDYPAQLDLKVHRDHQVNQDETVKTDSMANPDQRDQLARRETGANQVQNTLSVIKLIKILSSR